jgi:UDP-glucose 4-epimerase
VYVTDVANANLFAAKSKVEDTAINIGSGKETSINKLAMMVLEMMGSTSTVVRLPPRAADGRRSLADICKAKELIGYEPQINISEGLKALCKIQLEALI